MADPPGAGDPLAGRRPVHPTGQGEVLYDDLSFEGIGAAINNSRLGPGPPADPRVVPLSEYTASEDPLSGPMPGAAESADMQQPSPTDSSGQDPGYGGTVDSTDQLFVAPLVLDDEEDPGQTQPGEEPGADGGDGGGGGGMTVEDVRHYVRQIDHIFRPVLICMCLVIWWVKVEAVMRADTDGMRLFGFSTVETGDNIGGFIIDAIIIISAVIIMTIILAVMFWFGLFKIIFGYLIFSTGVLLGGMGALFAISQSLALNIPMDYITIVFAAVNFAVGGLVLVFYCSHLRLQQAYLTVMSALLAWSLTRINEITTWVLLGLLVIWDIIAVLTPCGPLKLLIAASRRHQKDIPALLYSVTMVWFMAHDPEHGILGGGKSSDASPVDSSDEVLAPVRTGGRHGGNGGGRRRQSTPPRGALLTDEGVELHDLTGPVPASPEHAPASEGDLRSGTEAEAADVDPHLADADPDAADTGAQEDEDAPPAEAKARDGLKLGLGDFVFYSVLLGRAALSDWTTTVTCLVAVSAGLMSTIFLLAFFRRALPALPISLVLGIIFFFVTRAVITPFVLEHVSGVVGL
ncbi:hypothetical protein H696_04506 [Fonticula alba]|uniref:Presenilin n=1 Tax=Fonticula alba TaxID=691883 RepID=A0A058Z4P1_FONAL|nr:hypothetical protein H696_04506 [Fonticula alba]KCV69091.1 hypothetical protein H696_04506 [Fonticula alba]|eukprot:XP_009496662.1 hypothetical protein H696_04506 [Fonticula alba]